MRPVQSATQQLAAASRGRRRRGAGDNAEDGAAVADFAMTAALTALLVLVVIQVGLALHIRNTLIWCAGEGARVGARVGSHPDAAAERARDLISQSLSDRFAGDVTASHQPVGDMLVVHVTVNAPVPVVGLWGPGRTMSVHARAYAREVTG